MLPERSVGVGLRNSLERLRQSAGHVPIRPLVVDSDILIRNLVREARPGTRPTKLLMQARMRTVRPFIATPQVDEVRRHLPRVAEAVGVDPNVAGQIFESRYLPLLQQVDMRGLLAEDPRVAAVQQVDSADVATAQLAVLLGTRVVTANRRHFGEIAIQHDWLAVVAAYADAGLLDGVNFGGAVSIQLTGEGVAGAARGLRRGYDYLTEHPRVALGFGVGLVIMLMLGCWYFADEGRRNHFKASVDLVTPRVAELVAYGATRYAATLAAADEAEPVLAATLLATQDFTIELQLARVLSSSRGPIPIETLAGEVSPTPLAEVRAALERYPAFVEDVDGWTLGFCIVVPARHVTL